MVKDTHLQIQEAQGPKHRTDVREALPSCIFRECSEPKMEKKILGSARRKWHVVENRTKMKVTTYFKSQKPQMLEHGRKSLFKWWKEELSPQNPRSRESILQEQGQIRNMSDEGALREFIPSSPALRKQRLQKLFWWKNNYARKKRTTWRTEEQLEGTTCLKRLFVLPLEFFKISILLKANADLGFIRLLVYVNIPYMITTKRERGEGLILLGET